MTTETESVALVCEPESVADVLNDVLSGLLNCSVATAPNGDCLTVVEMHIDYYRERIMALNTRIAAAHAREVGELEDRIDELSARHIHTCGPFCKREMCVARRDAKRYRWLRDSPSGHSAEHALYSGGSELDAFIDAAMGEPTREVIT